MGLNAPALVPMYKYGAVAAMESRVQRKALDKKHLAPVAQLDRALPSGGRGCWFDPSRAHFLSRSPRRGQPGAFSLMRKYCAVSD